MPYIKHTDYAIARMVPVAPGELNYAMTMRALQYLASHITIETLMGEVDVMCKEYINRVGISYTNINAVIGVLYCCGMELVRRTYRHEEAHNHATRASIQFRAIARQLYQDLAAPYEDIKIAENGDVFPTEFVT